MRIKVKDHRKKAGPEGKRLSERSVLMHYFSFSAVLLRDDLQKNHIDCKTRAILQEKLGEARHLSVWVKRHPKVDISWLKKDMKSRWPGEKQKVRQLLFDPNAWKHENGTVSGKSGNPARLVRLLVELSTWQHSKRDSIASVGRYSEGLRRSLDVKLNTHVSAFTGLRNNHDLRHILRPGELDIQLPPVQKIWEWASNSQSQYTVGLTQNNMQKFFESGRLRPAAVMLSQRKALPVYLFPRREVEVLAYPNKFESADAFFRASGLDGIRQEAAVSDMERFRRAQVRRSQEPEVTKDLRKVINRFLRATTRKSASNPRSGIDRDELLEACRKCLQYTEYDKEFGKWKEFIEKILPKLLRTLWRVFGRQTPSALLLLSDLKKFPSETETEIYKMNDEHWKLLAGETRDFCKSIVPAMKRRLGELFERLGYSRRREAGRTIYVREFKDTDTGKDVLIKAVPGVPYSLKIFINGKEVKHHWSYRLSDLTRNRIEDALCFVGESHVSLTEFINSMFHRASYTGTRDFFDHIVYSDRSNGHHDKSP